SGRDRPSLPPRDRRRWQPHRLRRRPRAQVLAAGARTRMDQRAEGVGMSAAQERATRFRVLHAPGELLLLANCWDAASARLIESCGAPAVATTSAGVAWAHGYPD